MRQVLGVLGACQVSRAESGRWEPSVFYLDATAIKCGPCSGKGRIFWDESESWKCPYCAGSGLSTTQQKAGWYLSRSDGSECGPWVEREEAVRALYEGCERCGK
jgi:RecJ-like exonuclease